jgi:hypothetical protein
VRKLNLALVLGLLICAVVVTPTQAHTSIPATGNLAIGSQVTASSTKSSSYAPAKVLDRVDSTRWEGSKSTNQWLRVDLGSARTLGKVSILWMASTTRTYQLQVSDNGSTWSTVASGTTNGSGTQLREHQLTNIAKRYVRVLALTLHSGSAYGHSIRELGIYAPPAAPSVEGFVQVCGTGLCLNGRPYGPIHAATTYGAFKDPAGVVTLAKEAGLGELELVNYSVIHHDLESQTAENTWLRVDRLVAEAKANGLRVILNFSGYGWSLNRAGIKGVTHNWGPFLSFVANRTNTVTGIRYAEEPAVLMLELWGEIPAPNYGEPGRGTTAETTEFFRRTLAQLHAAFPRHIGATGGFSHLNRESSGIDWRTIVSLPQSPLCQMEINSWNDRDITTPKFTQFCKDLGKPWSLAAFSSCEGTPHSLGDINHWATDSLMAAHHRDMYQVSRGAAPAAYPSVGAQFWNLRNDVARENLCSIGHQYPRTLAEVRAWA